MEQDGVDTDGNLLKSLNDSDERPRSAVNSVVLDYYKKFGRKRDLEQYFSLSTAQSDIRDPRSLFWRRMKEQSDTSDSGEKKSEESSNEICRISIKCSIPERSDVEKGDSQSMNDSESPPIITDLLPGPSPSGDESVDDNHSQKSAEGALDISINKPLSPTSSITSQRKLEWDSLADVGYGNESDRKTSASSLSTLEREVLAQKQQYTLDYKQISDMGVPTAHSTPVDANDGKSKGKKGQGKKTVSISRKDVDFVEVSVPQNIENAQPINVNLTKQFSVNLHQDGCLSVDNVKKDITITPERNVAELNTGVKMDKEIQTTLLKSNEINQRSRECVQDVSLSAQKPPILICLNTLRRRRRRKKSRNSRSKLKNKRKQVIVHEKDKSGEQVSEAESFEYMPGHIYNQNQMKQVPNRPANNNNVGNKSSLESSAVHTTDSSKESKYSFNKDLDKTLNVLKQALKEKYDSKLKNKLIAEIIHRLLKSNYGEGERTPDFLSVLSLNSKKTPTTSTSEADNTDEKVVHSKPKKSILRVNKFDSNNVASTSQSAPNLPSVVNSDKPVMSYLSKVVSSTTTETDGSNNSAKDVTSSDTVFAKTSSEELYKKYIDALKREEAYKQHLRDKELFLRQKLVRSETALKVPTQFDVRTNSKLKELIKDLTRNNYDDGSGDASKLEGGSSSNFDVNREVAPRKQRSHSVFTLSSGNSDVQNRSCLKMRSQREIVNSPRAGPSNLAASFHKPSVADSSVQVSINLHDKPLSNPQNIPVEDKYVCLCTDKSLTCNHGPDEFLVYKCPIQGRTPMINSKSYINNEPACAIHPSHLLLENDVNMNTCNAHPKKQKTIIECTRCLQTKISVQPKVSDPSVSDINIINSADCVKLINELYRKVSQTSSECQGSNEKEDTCKSSKDNIRRYGDERYNFVEEENEMAPLTGQQMPEQDLVQTCVGCQKTFTSQAESISDNIVIPIQGTNMMLKVSIGEKTMKVEGEKMPKVTLDHINMVDRDIVTDKIKTSLKGTCILDECSKSVQAENSGDTNKNIIAVAPCGVTINKENKESLRETVPSSNATNKERDFMPRKDKDTSSCNTYPKSVQINDKKPFFRSNTATGNLATNSAIQTDTIYNKDKEIQPYFNAQMKQDISPRGHPKSKDEFEMQSQTAKQPPGAHSVSGTSNICGDSFRKAKEYETVTDEGKPNDLILDVIKDITKRYSKKETDKRNKKKCFKEIMTALSYLLDTDDSGDGDQEFSTKIKNSKAIQCSSEQSSQSEVIANHLLNDADGNKSASCKKRGSPILAHGSRKFIKPQNNSDEKVCSCGGGSSDCKDCIPSRSAESEKGNCKEISMSEKLETRATIKNETAYQKGCRCGCGLANCKDCHPPRSAESEIDICGMKSSRSENHETRSTLERKSTHEKSCSCGCGFSNCKVCNSPRSAESEKGTCGMESSMSETLKTSHDKPCNMTSRYTEIGTRSSDRDSSRFQKQIKTLTNKNKTTCVNECGCDGSSECKDCAPLNKNHVTGTCGEESLKPKTNESSGNPCNKTKTTCDMGCGCDGSSDCKDCLIPHSPRYGTGDSKASAKSKSPERCSSPQKTRNTCDKANSHSPRRGSRARSIESTRSKKHEARTDSPQKTKMTCDKGCGCVGTKECKDCVGPHSPRYKTGTCGKESGKSSQRESRSNSPRVARTTCDKGCGCDVSSDCRECVDEPHSSKYGTGKCDKQSTRSENEDRCKSPNKPTCDKGCGVDSSQCQECNHKAKCKEDSNCKKQNPSSYSSKKFVNRCVQSTVKRVKSLYSHCDESSDIPTSTDHQCCSSDSPTAKLVNKIKKECDKYQKRCKLSCKKCEASSSTAVSCDHCKRQYHCRCHRCRCHRNRSMEKMKKKCVAYNLIVQTSDSVLSEDTVFDRCRPLQNVIVRVPKCKPNVPFKEACAKIEQKLPNCGTSYDPKGRSHSWPNECGISSTDDVKMATQCTVRDYLERNRPEFVDRCANRQNCIKMTSETRARERSELREQMVGLGTLQSLNNEELIYLAKQLGLGRRRPLQKEIISEREMKKHSEKIYKSLPEVIQKKEDAKKESMKKTNLLMANIFKKNLQKKTLSGDVNISNYSQVVKI